MNPPAMSAPETCSRCGGARVAGALGVQCPACVLESSLDAAGEPAPPGARRFGNYDLLDEIGRGGMGVVYRAWEPGLEREVAVKLLLGGAFAGGEFLQRFRAESRLTARLRHPGIVAVFEAGEVDGQAFHAMEWIDGPTLAERLRAGAMPAREAAALVEKIARALEHAHGQDVLHRDLKPSNILLDADGSPKVADFGLARSWRAASELTLTGGALGSPPYMAPEQAAGRGDAVGPATDVYGLGAILYHALTGRPPHQGSSPEETLAHVREAEIAAPRLLNPSVPLDLQTVCLKALENEGARRYPTAAALADDLARFLAGEPVSARPVGFWGKSTRWAGRNRSLAAALALLALSLAGGIAATIWQWRQAVLHAAATDEERYISDVFAAGLAYRSGDWSRAREILSAWIPETGNRGDEDRRGLEWRLLWGRTASGEARELCRRGITVTGVAFSPGGKEVAIADQSGLIEFRDTATGELSVKPGALGTARGERAGYLGGDRVVCGPRDGQIDVYNAATGELQWSLPGRQWSASADGGRLAVGAGIRYYWTPRGGEVAVWDTAARQRVFHLPGAWRGVALSADGRRLVLTGQDGGLSLVTVEGGAIEHWPSAGRLWAPAFSSDGRWLAAAGDGEAMVWDLESPRLPPVVLGQVGALWDTAFYPGEARLATAGSDRCVRVWEAGTGEMVRLLPGHTSEVWTVAVAPSGGMLASGGKDCIARIWPPDALPAARRYPSDAMKTPVFDREGLVLTFAGDEARWIDPDTGAVARVEPTPTRGAAGHGREWLDGGRMVADLSSDATITVRDPAAGRSWTFAGMDTRGRYGIAADATRGRLAVCLEPEKFVRLIDLESGREQRLWGDPATIYYFTGVAFSPDGALLAGADLAGPIHLWRVADGEWLGSFAGHPQETSGLAFAPDGRTLASIGYGQSLKLWHVATRREFLTLDEPRAMDDVSLSPDGRRIAITLGEGGVGVEEVEVIEAR